MTTRNMLISGLVWILGLYAYTISNAPIFKIVGLMAAGFVGWCIVENHKFTCTASECTDLACEFVRDLNVGDPFDANDKDAIMQTGGVRSVVGALVEVEPTGNQRNPRVVPCTEYTIIENQVEFVVLNGSVSDIVYRISMRN